MERTELIEKFRSLAGEITERDFAEVSERARILELGVDSLAMLELIGTLEREFDIWIRSEDLDAVHTVGELLDLVETKVEAAHVNGAEWTSTTRST